MVVQRPHNVLDTNDQPVTCFLIEADTLHREEQVVSAVQLMSYLLTNAPELL